MRIPSSDLACALPARSIVSLVAKIMQHLSIRLKLFYSLSIISRQIKFSIFSIIIVIWRCASTRKLIAYLILRIVKTHINTKACTSEAPLSVLTIIAIRQNEHILLMGPTQFSLISFSVTLKCACSSGRSSGLYARSWPRNHSCSVRPRTS